MLFSWLIHYAYAWPSEICDPWLILAVSGFVYCSIEQFSLWIEQCSIYSPSEKHYKEASRVMERCDGLIKQQYPLFYRFFFSFFSSFNLKWLHKSDWADCVLFFLQQSIRYTVGHSFLLCSFVANNKWFNNSTIFHYRNSRYADRDSCHGNITKFISSTMFLAFIHFSAA